MVQRVSTKTPCPVANMSTSVLILGVTVPAVSMGVSAYFLLPNERTKTIGIMSIATGGVGYAAAGLGVAMDEPELGLLSLFFWGIGSAVVTGLGLSEL